MKYIKLPAAVGLILAGLMAFAVSASATVVTSPAGTALKGGSKIEAELTSGTEATFKSSFIGEVKCKKASGGGVIANAGGAESTPSGELGFGTFSECNASITVLNTGTGEVHTEGTTANSNGTFTSNGAEVTIELLGLHCIFKTSNTDSGQVMGGAPATLVINSVPIPRTGGRSGAFCGSSASLSARFTVTSPSPLFID